MMNRLCQLCLEAGVPLQIHTCMQRETRYVLLDRRPTLLNSLFCRYPELRVDLFHGGYPWYVQAGLMAKYFPNVYIDGNWGADISPSGYGAALTAWIDTVPMNKILARGGDHMIIEHACVSLSVARDPIVEVLVDLAEREYCDLDLMLIVARRILCDNGADFWGLQRHSVSTGRPRALPYDS